MAENKTQKTGASVEDFINSVGIKRRREDGFTLLELMKEVTGEEPEMWGPSIIGFGDYHYRYESGREGDFFLTAFSPRKQSLSLYIMAGFEEYDSLLASLGKHRKGASCLYINKLADVDMGVLRELIEKSVEQGKANNVAA
ncbi:MAG: DUF1801 domain-containing protein [Dehalococcoidia bacterium]|nr:DUF1801 domain-containing protein [Dehalococcoidia bacterium]